MNTVFAGQSGASVEVKFHTEAVAVVKDAAGEFVLVVRGVDRLFSLRTVRGMPMVSPIATHRGEPMDVSAFETPLEALLRQT